MKLTNCLIIGSIFLMTTSVFAEVNSFESGARGFDPALKGQNSKRFSVKRHDGDINLIDIWVDSKEVQMGIKEIKLISPDKTPISSDQCFKTERHITAPMACSFREVDLKDLSGEGKIQVLDEKQHILHEDKIDFGKLNEFLRKP